jgi:hypothetical protein
VAGVGRVAEDYEDGLLLHCLRRFHLRRKLRQEGVLLRGNRLKSVGEIDLKPLLVLQRVTLVF